ncbi:M-phase inducer phosphatase-like isoform X1 [Rhopilema esculentum]|uniref:M-phase inducer phosphatase-like isoform X1 n=1 Tax=Rhopilema esculentum TaxID=499914 RepID=UPI0031E46734
MAQERKAKPKGLHISLSSQWKNEPSIANDGQPAISPMTELAINFKQSCKSYSSTPRRRLSLTDIQNTPTPIKSLSKADSTESGICMDFSNDVIDSPTLCDIRARSKRSSTSEFSLRRRATLQRSNSMQATSSFALPLAFKLNEEEFSPVKKADKHCQDDKEIALELDSVGLPDELTLMPDIDDSTHNRSISAPPVLDSIDTYCVNIVGRSTSPASSDGFDFIEDDENSNDGSIPKGMSNLISGKILNKENESRKTRKVSQEDKENVFPLTQNVIPENKPVDDHFKRPSQLIRRIQKRSVSFSVKRPESQMDFSPISSKRTKIRSQSLYNADEQLKKPLFSQHHPMPRLARSLSVESPSKHKEDIFGCDDKNLIGDKSKPCCLPLLEKGQHPDLKSISPATLCKVLDGEYSGILDEAIIVDCRYPYEFKGGHIKTAINIYTKEEMVEQFLQKLKSQPSKRTAIIFHCEFSSKRGPTLCRFLRNKDRDIHRTCYPTLFYPELYILEGGYRDFFNEKKEYCEPQAYLKMVDEKFSQDLKHFTKRSKSWSGENSRMRCGLRY